MTSKLEHGLGVDDLKRRLEEKLNLAIGALTPFEDVVTQTKEITTNINAVCQRHRVTALWADEHMKFEAELNDFRRHPADKMFTIVYNGQ